MHLYRDHVSIDAGINLEFLLSSFNYGIEIVESYKRYKQYSQHVKYSYISYLNMKLSV